MAKYTPMIEQYLQIKAEVPDAFLFFRLGDFYELFFDDAVEAARELEITLTSRGGGAEDRIPMCGVPYHSAESYIQRLIEKGFKVAICEQVEDPSEAKGVVRREIVRIVSPGTVMDGKSVNDKANNFIASIVLEEEEAALSVCDLSTGELYTTLLPSSISALLDELNIYQPSEVIGAKGLLDLISQDTVHWGRKVLFTARDDGDSAALKDLFAKEDLAQLTALEHTSTAVLIDYLKETQKRSLSHLTQLRKIERHQYMLLDPFTRRNLELVETVRDRGKAGSLLWLLDKTVTSMGGRMLRRWLDKPLLHKRSVEERLEAVNVLYHQFILREDLKQHLKEIYDLERLVGRVAFGTANAKDLNALKISLAQIPALIELCSASDSSTLQQLVHELDACQDIFAWIDEAIVEDPPLSVREGGMIKSGFDPYLDQLHDASTNGKQWIAELEHREKAETGIKSLKIGYNKVFGYYIEVTRANLASLPEGRYERKQTLANAERFVTPELKEKEALILEAEEKMVGLEYEIFSALRERINAEVSRLQRLAEHIAVLDVYQSLAAVSSERRFVKPQLHDGYHMRITGGRHPVVEAVMKDGAFIPNDTIFTQDEERMLLITGPNMAGKSTYMRQVALICIMAQIGCFVPAESAEMPMIDRIFTRIGAADDLISGQSTFMVEMKDIQVMTERATERSLVIIDELGRGTSTSEGMSIAQAVIEFLHELVGCKTLVSTHFHELAHLEDSLTYLKNGCMAVKESGEQVTFLRKLIPGAADTSYGIYCARIAGLPERIISRSYELLSQYEHRSIKQEPVTAELKIPASLQGQSTASTASIATLVKEGDDGQAIGADVNTAATTEDIVQLSFFEDQASSRGKKSSKVLDEASELIVKRVREVDLLNMTPLQAMNFLYELKQKS